MMCEEQVDSQSCPFCWDQRHKCLREADNDDCRNCKRYNIERRDGGLSVDLAPPSFDSSAHEVLYKSVDRNSLSSLDIDVRTPERNIFVVRLTKSTGQPPSLYTFNIEGLFNIQNTNFVTLLDSMALDALSTPLKDRNVVFNAIHMATLICGYAHLLCSTILATEEVKTIRDGVPCVNEHTQNNLQAHLQFIVYSRLCELLKISLERIRFEDLKGQHPELLFNSFAAAAILRYGITFFRHSLRHGYLSAYNHMSNGFKLIINDLFKPIEIELTQRTRGGCSRYPDWKNAIKGSLKKFRRKHETLRMNLTLEQIKFTTSEPQPSSWAYAAIGSGNVFLLSPKLKPTLQVPRLSYNNPGEIEQLPSHVSGPLSHHYDTWEETSDLDARDLFHDLQSTYVT